MWNSARRRCRRVIPAQLLYFSLAITSGLLKVYFWRMPAYLCHQCAVSLSEAAWIMQGWRQLTPQGHHHVPPAFLESLGDPSWFPAHTPCGMSHTTWVLSTSRRGISKALQKLHEVPKLRCLHLEANPNRCPMIKAGNLYWFWLGWT